MGGSRRSNGSATATTAPDSGLRSAPREVHQWYGAAVASTLHAFFDRYSKAFAAYDVDAVLKLVHRPCLVASGADLVALQTEAELRERFERQFERHRELRVGGATFEVVASRRLTPRITRADVQWTFQTEVGTALPSFGLSYTLVEPEAGWTIATVFPLEL